MQIVTRHRGQEAKPDIDSWLDWIGTPSGWIEAFTDTAGEPTGLYDYQADIINDEHPFIIADKSRRVGWSIIRSLRALVVSHLKPETESQIISLNLKECRKKIRYARRAWETLPSAVRQGLVVDNRLELEFANGSRISSVFNPRGEGDNLDIDEMAHLAEDRQEDVYTDGLPCVTRGGQMAIGSTPLGKSGKFYQVLARANGKYQRFHRYHIHWWDCPDLCTNVQQARSQGLQMPSRERVQRWGTERLQAIFDNLPEEDFQQEYELLYIDDTTAFLPYSLLIPATEPPPQIYDTLEELRAAATGNLYAGYDVGRKKDTSELTILEKLGDRFYERFHQTLDKTPYKIQEATLEDVLRILGTRLVRMSIDANGIGAMLAENLAGSHGSRIEENTMSNPVKERMATAVKVSFEQGNIRIHPDQERIGQLHSIKKIPLPGGKSRYDTLRNEKHHGDKAWSIILAHWAGSNQEGLVNMADLDNIPGGREATGAWGE